MSTQRALLGSTGLATLVAALLLTAAIVVPSRADRVVLDTSILESSRGGNQAGNLSSYTCDKNNGNFGC
jgi:hypothetical protein